MKTSFRYGISLICCLAIVMNGVCLGQVNELKRTAPELQGVPSGKVTEFFDFITSLETTEIHSALLMRYGYVIGEIHPQPFSAEYGHTLFSCSKTFTSAAIGIAVAENRIKLNDRLAAFFPELLPDTISDGLAAITIKDLLTMTSGFKPTDRVRTSEQEWVKSYLANEMVAAPGTKFAYDSMDTYLLSAIIQKVTGTTMLEYLKQKLFEPLHITTVNWEWSPEGITCGGWGLYLQTESLAKFGQLLLNKGKWEGKQLLDSSWVTEMMRPHVKRDKGDAYCYQMWQCAHPNAARADGAYGQYIIVMPDEEMVAVITQSITGDAGGKERAFLFENLLPSLNNHPSEPGKDYSRLLKKQQNYALAFAQGKKQNKKAASCFNKEYKLAPNNLGWDSLSLQQTEEGILLSVHTEKCGVNNLLCGYKEWKESSVQTLFPPNARGTTLGAFNGFSQPFKAASSYGWSDNMRLNIKNLFVDWMSGLHLTLIFEGNNLTIQYKENYTKKESVIKGKQ